MLSCKHNQLCTGELEIAEKVMNSYFDEEWCSVGLSFNPWEYSRAEKHGILLAIFKTTNVLAILELTPSEMLEFCLDIETLYKNVPYHSFNHALDVVFKLHYVLYDLQASAYLASYDIASLLIAGLCHDAGHPGLNNLFQKNANTELARKYPDAILERYSIDLAEEYITKHELLRNVENLRDPMYSDGTATQVDVASRMMYSIKTAILHTDMTRHFDIVEECKVLVSMLSKKARRISEHEAYQRDCGIDPLSHHQDQFGMGSGTSTPHESAKSPVHLRVAKQVVRARSPSEPPAPTKSFFTYSLLNPVSTTTMAAAAAAAAAAVSRDGSEETNIPSTPSMFLKLPEIGGASDSAKHSPKNGKGRRLQVRRSVSMRDALLDSAQRQSLINILLHAVDVFNPVLPWHMCKKWSDLMNIESFHQGDLEKKLRLPVSPNMDRESTDQRQVSLDFGNIIIRPFFSELVSLFPVEDGLLSALESNIQKWSRLSSDTSHEISPPAGANNNMYSWPTEPVETPVLRASSGPLFEGRRLSVAAGTVDIPSSRLEMIRRHSHEGFEALHRRMVGRLFSKHLEKIQERRKMSYTSNQQPQMLFERQCSPPSHALSTGESRSPDNGRNNSLMLSPGYLNRWKGFDSDMLSPVTEASCLDDNSVPSSAVGTEFGSDCLQTIVNDRDNMACQRSPGPMLPPTPQISANATNGWGGVPAGRGAVVSICGDPRYDGSGMATQMRANPYLNNYRLDMVAGNSRMYRSSSLDPSMLSHLPTSYPTLAGSESTTGRSSAEVTDSN
ncbi:hypothetical protein GGI15_003122 [Coemansia interrupta]|uniref:PDEase domain-containing protein n=1 Tax=Coemansia interrupta TaxID=1126814 RepID=A0A9W8HGX8_9FUNG|nr:hypothetical protein GGI15_003122 [Coemansia interrupta]